MTASDSKPTVSDSELTLHLIATGVVKLYEAVKNGKAPSLPYPVELQRGLDRLVLVCLGRREKPPQGVPDLLSWCRRPLAEWPLELPEDAGTGDKLLDGQSPTGICDEWAIASSDVEAELTQHKLLINVMEVCRTAKAPDSYVAFRRLLISEPVLTAFDLLKRCNDPLLERLDEQINAAYELAPQSCVLEGQFHCCSPCGNIMLRTVKGELICAEERCRLKGVAKAERQIAQKKKVFWLKRGLRRFIAAPGLAELRLEEKLKKLGLEVELWPNFDSYDLRIVFADGEAWAIDVKDWANPFLLARKLSQKEEPLIPSNPPWSKAYFVFPDDRRQQRTDYLRAFKHHCTLPKRIKAKFEKDFIKDVKKKLEREK